MITVRRADERGKSERKWLDSRHTFSFADYYDPRHMGFRTLRVINDDHIAPGGGFPPHPHRDMEILSVVFSGGLAHQDSMGNGSVIRPGEVQRMTAGTGVVHSEANASEEEPVHLLQIWLLPEREGLAPGYEQRAFPDADEANRLRLVASHDGREGSLTIHQDVDLYETHLSPGASVTHALAPGRHAWVQVATGEIDLNGSMLHTGDGAAVSDEPKLTLTGRAPAEVLLFDLA